MKFTKLQGTGNDFILAETADSQRDWAPLARAMCGRHFGIGGDGLLLLLPSQKADFRMRMFNPDGSEAEACGNGLRCVARYIIDMGLADFGVREIMIETVAGIRRVKLHREGNKVTKIQVGMGTPKFEASDIPVTIEPGKMDTLGIKPMLDYPVNVEGRGLLLSLVSMGNPHAVYFGSSPVADFPLSQMGPKVEYLTIFPQRVNFEVARVLNRQQVEVRVWERGAGETLSCGSGAGAVAVAGQLHDYLDHTVDVKLPGGILEVQWDGVGEIFLSGPAEIVFSGEWPE